MEEPGNY